MNHSSIAYLDAYRRLSFMKTIEYESRRSENKLLKFILAQVVQD